NFNPRSTQLTPLDRMTAQLPTFADIVARAPDGVVVIDVNGIIVYANERTADLFGFTIAELVDRKVETLLPERFRKSHVENRRGYAQQPVVRPMGTTQQSFVGRRKDDTEFPVEIQLAPLQDQNGSWTLAFVRDATERQIMLAQIKDSMHAAQEVSRIKGEFLSFAAHDLSQPVQTLELVCGSIKRLALPTTDLAELSALASSSLSRVRELLKMLLDISRIESGRLNIVDQPVSITDIYEDLERQFAPIARAKTLTFRSNPCPRIVETDPALLRGMLSNLVANATRYTSHGEVFIECTTPLDGSLQLAVHDTGIGIPPEQLDTIFEDFYRGPDAEQVARDGFGLGLGIVRRLSNLLGFPVLVQSELGRGSTFAVHIPKDKVFPIPSDVALA
ncbi:MAG TPA: PAS domain-containing sensor histidine kinase, partial [Steroidobacteraceae bacterium]|nr:PAS domain-containing sensor histidine kinase [Steroidobacteraceae bacterium]